jgi:DnaJ-class molecular chaperone
METKDKANKFNYFENHGNDTDTDNFTICFGDPGESAHIIVGAEDTEDSAKEACKRLNEIMELNNPLSGFTPAMIATIESLNRCTKCDGSGELIPDKECDRCNGTGFLDSINQP